MKVEKHEFNDAFRPYRLTWDVEEQLEDEALRELARHKDVLLAALKRCQMQFSVLERVENFLIVLGKEVDK